MKNKTGGGVGTNQYRVRGASQVQSCVPEWGVVPALSEQPDLLPWERPEVQQVLQDHQIDPDACVASIKAAAEPIDGLMRDPRCSYDVLETVLRTKQPWGHGALINAMMSHPRCPAELLRRCALDPTEVGRFSLAVFQKPDIEPLLWAAMADSVHSNARYELAKLPQCPTEIVARLARDPCPAVKGEALAHPQCPLPFLQAALSDPVYHSRLASNPNTPPVLLAQLERSEATDGFLSTRPDCPPGILISMAQAGTQTENLINNPATPAQALCLMVAQEEFTFYLSPEVAAHPACDAACVQVLAGRNSPYARQAVAGHPACPPEILQRLVSSRDVDVLKAAAGNPALPEAFMAKLISNKDPGVRERILQHPRLPAHIRTIALLSR